MVYSRCSTIFLLKRFYDITDMVSLGRLLDEEHHSDASPGSHNRQGPRGEGKEGE